MENITRIMQVSGRFRLFFSGLVLIVPILDVLFWLLYNHLPAEGSLVLRLEVRHDLDILTRLLLFFASLIPISVATYGFYTLVRLFRLYERGIVFSAENVRYYRRLGFVIIFWVLAKFVFTPLSSVIISLNNPPGERFLSVGFHLLDGFALLIGAVVLLVSWVMDEGRKMEDEQAHTV